VLLRDPRAVQRDVRPEHLIDAEVRYGGARWVVTGLDLAGPTVRLTAGNGQEITLTGEVAAHIEFPGDDGEHFTLGPERHGIVRMPSSADATAIAVPLEPGQRFEARLRDRELQGPYEIIVNDDGSLSATGTDRDGNPETIAIRPEDVAPRYAPVYSSDFDAPFDVDSFRAREDQVRGQATHVGEDPDGPVIQDPLLGSLPPGYVPQMTSGADHIAVFEQFVRDHTQPDASVEVTTDSDGRPRSVTVFNIDVNTEGSARTVIDALVEFRRQNPDAEITIVATKLGDPSFHASPEFREYLDLLADHRINVDAFTGPDGPTRQVIHAKGIVVDGHVLLSTAAVIDPNKNKADFSLELPPEAADAFRRYTDEAIHGDATPDRRQELARELAQHGVVINDPVAGLPYISRAHDALIRGATSDLLISLSELVDPDITRRLIERADSGVNVVIQVRELDPESQRLLQDAIARGANLHYEDANTWQPRPHYNVIVADHSAAYVGTSYLWPTQRNMVHHGRSFESGVLLSGGAAASVHTQIAALHAQVHGEPPPPATGPAVERGDDDVSGGTPNPEAP